MTRKGQKRERTWRDGLDRRLRQLIKAHGPSQAAFAKACGIDAPRVTAWLGGETHPGRKRGATRAKPLPSAAHLHAIAESCGVSLDWLLFGDGGDEPIYRGQSRPDARLEAELANDVAARVLREMSQHASPEERAWLAAVLTPAAINVRAILSDAAATVMTETRRLRTDAGALTDLLTLSSLVRGLSAHLPRNAQVDVTDELRLIERRVFSETNTVGNPRPMKHLKPEAWLNAGTRAAEDAERHEAGRQWGATAPKKAARRGRRAH
jgi:transcriptional regulator with XRE-family HTH domain